MIIPTFPLTHSTKDYQIPPLLTTMSAIPSVITSIFTIMQMMEGDIQGKAPVTEAPSTQINGSGGYTGAGPIHVHNHNVNTVYAPTGTALQPPTRAARPAIADICQAVRDYDYVQSALRPHVVETITGELQKFTPDETRGVLQLVLERLDGLGGSGTHRPQPLLPSLPRHGRVRREPQSTGVPSGQVSQPGTTLNGLPYAFLEPRLVKPTAKHLVASRLYDFLLPLEPVNIILSLGAILVHALTEGDDPEADCLFYINHYPCRAIPRHVLQTCEAIITDLKCRNHTYLGARGIYVGDDTIEKFLKLNTFSFIVYVMQNNYLDWRADTEDARQLLRAIVSPGMQDFRDASRRRKREAKKFKLNKVRRPRPTQGPRRDAIGHFIVSSSSSSGSSSGSASPFRNLPHSPGSAQAELARAGMINARLPASLFGAADPKLRRSSSSASSVGQPPAKRPRLDNSPTPPAQARDSAGLLGRSRSEPNLASASAARHEGPISSSQPGALRRSWETVSEFSNRQGDRLLSWKERHPLSSGALSLLGSSSISTGVFVMGQAAYDAATGATSADMARVEELETRTKRLEDSKHRAEGAATAMKEVMVHAVHTGQVPEALVHGNVNEKANMGPSPATLVPLPTPPTTTRPNPSKGGDGGNPGVAFQIPPPEEGLSILLEQFGQRIRDPKWRPDPSLLTKEPELYMLALMTPYFLGRERESEKRYDEKPIPISPARAVTGSGSWLDTAHLSAPPDPVADRHTLPLPVPPPALTEKDHGIRYRLIFGLSSLLAGLAIGIGLYLCRRKRPGFRNVRDVSPGRHELLRLK